MITFSLNNKFVEIKQFFNKAIIIGTDIHMYMECHSRKKKHYTYHGKLEGYRLYGLFGIMADVFTNEEPLYYSRGLPGDVTNQVYRAYKDERGDAHHASWLNTEEIKEMLGFSK